MGDYRRSTRAITSTPNQYGYASQRGGYRPRLNNRDNQNSFTQNQQNNQPPPQQQQQQEVKPQLGKVPIPEPPQIAPLLGVKNEEQNPAPEVMEVCEGKSDDSVSATTKALSAMEGEPKWKKGTRLSKSQRRKKLNRMLARLVSPKSALMLLHEFRPNCVYRFTEACGFPNPSYLAEVLIDNNVVAIGQGVNKVIAKNIAAENALKYLISSLVKEGQELKKEQPQSSAASADDSQDSEQATPTEQLPWAGLAAYAMYRLFNEWENEGLQVPQSVHEPPRGRVNNALSSVTAAKKSFGAVSGVLLLSDQTISYKAAAKPCSALPPNAKEMHPTALLNQMRPDAFFSELSRTPGPDCVVTVSVLVGGETYTASAHNRKEARKEVSKIVIKELYGIDYDS